MVRSKATVTILLLASVVASGPVFGFWTRKVRFTFPPEIQDSPKVAVSGCTAYVAWIDETDNSLYYNRSIDGGTTWRATPVLETGGGARPIIQIEIAVTEKQLHLVWQEGAGSEARIEHHAIHHNGSSSTIPRYLSDLRKSSEQPTLAVDGDDVYVAWLQTRRGSDTRPAKLFFTASHDGGETWSRPKKVDRRSVGLARPLLVPTDDQLHLLWGRLKNVDGVWDLDILHRSSQNQGERWNRRTTAVDGGWRISDAAADNGVLHLLWEDASYKLAFTKYQRSADAGQTWSPALTLDQGSYASITAHDGALEAISIGDWDGTGTINHRRSSDAGRTWSKARRLARNARYPALAGTAIDESCGGATHLTFGKGWWKNDHYFQEVFYRRHPRRTGW